MRVSVQRLSKTLSQERRKRLDKLGFVWGVREAAWEEGFYHLKLYQDRVGHCNVPVSHKENGFALGQWVINQRARKDNLTEERRRRLDKIGFVWDPFEQDFEEGLAELKLFKDRVGHCNVKQNHITENGFQLGRWLSNQRTKKNKNKLSPERRQRLEELGVVWNVRQRKPLDISHAVKGAIELE